MRALTFQHRHWGAPVNTTLRPRRAAALCAMFAAVLIAGPPTASASPPVIEKYVALGDSVSAGNGTMADPDLPDDNGSGHDCYRTTKAYPTLLQQSFTIQSSTIAACSGAETQDVLSTQVDALDASTTAVTITIGANDLDWGNAILHCAAVDCNYFAPPLAISFTTLGQRLAATYAEIAQRAPNAHVVVVGYPHPFSSSYKACGWFQFMDTFYNRTERQLINGLVDKADAQIEANANAFGFTFVDLRSAFGSHGVCASKGSGSTPYTYSGRWIVNPFDGSNTLSAFHPNAPAHQAMASLVAAALNEG